MGKIKKYANGIERFLHGEKGQRFFNFAYSIGAAIVIWGALFKILHLPGGSTLLCIGMGTEIAMFILTAFDRPPKEYAWEEVFPALDRQHSDHRPDMTGLPAGVGGQVIINGSTPLAVDSSGYQQGDAYPQPQEGENAGFQAAAMEGIQPTVAGLPSAAVAVQAAGLPAGIELAPEDTESLRESIAKMSAAADQLSQMAELTSATQQYLEQISGIAEQMSILRDTTARLNQVSDALLASYTAITDNSEGVQENSTGYVERMADLNRNIGGLNTIYEIQLKSVSAQLESIDRVGRGLKDIRDMYEKSARQSSRYCEETEKMARYMQQLNSVYEKMITAMTINMYNPMMGGQRPADDFNPFGAENRETADQSNS